MLLKKSRIDDVFEGEECPINFEGEMAFLNGLSFVEALSLILMEF